MNDKPTKPVPAAAAAASPKEDQKDQQTETKDAKHHTLKYSLLGPSLMKSGQDAVDQEKVSEIIYEASKGSKFFQNEAARDAQLTIKIAAIQARKAELEKLDLSHDLRRADDYIAELELSRDLSQTLVHVDCDAFYAAVELLDRSELTNVPFAVGGGVLTTCNYHARVFGCRSGMAGFVAKKLCPDLVMIPLNFEKYTKKAQETRGVFAKYDPRFESASMDEAYMNITNYMEEHDMAAEDVVHQLRAEVYENAKITVSAGIAANAKLAKICSNINKPNGQYYLPKDTGYIMKFMRDLPTRKVNGIGRVFERELDAIGIKTCGDIYQYRQYLPALFGEKSFWFLMQCYLGLGRTEVHPAEEYERKSVGTERTFGDLKGHEALCAKMRAIAEDLEKDMARNEVKGRTLVLKVKLHTYEVFTRQTIPPKAVHLANDLYKYALPMLAKLEKEFPPLTLRLLGLRCTHLVSMKRPDTDAFFGLKRKASGDAAPASTVGRPLPIARLKRKMATGDDYGEWEQWPDAEFEEAEREEHEEELEELEQLSQDVDAKQSSSRPTSKKQEEVGMEEEWWNCPICSRPQPALERDFNGHIDLCLSRGAIKKAVQESSRQDSSESSTPVHEVKRPRIEKKGNSRSRDDRRQTKLSFS